MLELLVKGYSLGLGTREAQVHVRNSVPLEFDKIEIT